MDEGKGGPGGALLVGVGNDFRGDDAAGLLVAREVRKLVPSSIAVTEDDGDIAHMIDAWRGYRLVILVDAARTGRQPGEIYRFDALHEQLPVFETQVSSHGVGIPDAIELARALNALPQELVVYGVEAESFRTGAPLSAPVAAAIPEVASRIAAELTRLPA